MEFRNPTCGVLDFPGVINELCSFLAEDAGASYAITIGSDSEMHDDVTEFISAIAVHRVGRGARYFWMQTEKPRYRTLRDRIWQEAILSTTLAQSVLDALEARDAWRSHIGVHVDIGEHGPTHELIREITGFVRAHGFIISIKPYSYAASAVADRYA